MEKSSIGQAVSEQALCLLTFKLGEELFAIDVAQSKEVLDLQPITRMPNFPEHMLGLINIRGSVVPVADLRVKFGLPKVPNTPLTRIVVLDIVVNNEQITLGAVADSVQEVIELYPRQIKEPPKIGSKWNSEFIKGIGNKDEQFIIILDINKIFSTEKVSLIDSEKTISSDEELNASDKVQP